MAGYKAFAGPEFSVCPKYPCTGALAVGMDCCITDNGQVGGVEEL